MNIKKVELITNNPRKVEHLKNLGINVIKKVPIKITPNKHNKKYLETKMNKSGHSLAKLVFYQRKVILCEQMLTRIL